MVYIAYYRVSTKKQGDSGLGLEAQRQAVLNFCKDSNFIKGEFTDVESGKKDNRPELLKAIEQAKRLGATLVIAKLDRLSRNLTFISNLMDSGVRFICCDMPEANEFTIHIFAALAQQERKLISKRTREALQAKKSQGTQLGKPENLTAIAVQNSVATRIKNARSNPMNQQASGYIKVLRESQGLSFEKIAQTLNEQGFKSSKHHLFKAMTVKRLYDRTKALKSADEQPTLRI
jgi:DNA invertase Pin-like site-specific DNA recombinase